jgi:hypothetical protein
MFSNIAALISLAEYLIILKILAYCGDYGIGQFVVKLRSKIHANLCNIIL